MCCLRKEDFKMLKTFFFFFNLFFFPFRHVQGGSDGKAYVYNVRDLGSIPGLGRFPGEGNGNSLQYSCLENPMDGGAWCRLLSMGSQRVGHDWATSLHFTSPSGTHQKEITRCYSQWPCGYECFQWTALSLNDYWVSTVILPWCQAYSKGGFPIVFALQNLYYIFLTLVPNIYT